jgi:hypothetical protein
MSGCQRLGQRRAYFCGNRAYRAAEDFIRECRKLNLRPGAMASDRFGQRQFVAS